MKPQYSFAECYQILKIKPNCSWSDLRKSYKSQIQKWHPDRFDDKSDKKIAANEKIKSLNIAYNHVSRYFKENGELPPIIKKTHKEPQKVSRPTASNIPNKTDNLDNIVKKKAVTSIKSVIFILVAASFLILLNESELPQNNFHPLKQTNDTSNSIDITSNTDSQSKSTPEPKATSQLSKKPDSTDFLTPTSKNLISTEPVNTDDKDEDEEKFFTYGSTFGNVVYVQGTPDKIENDTWFYGNSKVIFSEGKVIGWKRKPGSPLKANIIINGE